MRKRFASQIYGLYSIEKVMLTIRSWFRPIFESQFFATIFFIKEFKAFPESELLPIER